MSDTNPLKLPWTAETAPDGDELDGPYDWDVATGVLIDSAGDIAGEVEARFARQVAFRVSTFDSVVGNLRSALDLVKLYNDRRDPHLLVDLDDLLAGAIATAEKEPRGMCEPEAPAREGLAGVEARR